MKKLLDYDPETGNFTWKVNRGNQIHIGDVAGYLNKHLGYRMITLDNRLYYAHRLAILYMTGEFPRSHTDHKRGRRADNRWEEIREATQGQNLRNRKARGYYRSRKTHGWNVKLMVDRRVIYIGTFKTRKEAKAAYLKACERHHGSEWMARKVGA